MTDPASSFDRNRTLLMLAMIAVAIVPYVSALGFGFVYDDHLAIEENPHLKLWPGLQRIFFSNVWSLSGLGKDSNYYRPMFVLAYEGVVHAVGVKAWAFHLANLLFHALTTVMVFLLTMKLWKKNSIAVIATILFAIHPTRAEPVAWVAALSELAYTFFVLLALYFYVDERQSRWRLPLALSSFGMALLWKESAVSFIPLAVLFDLIVRRQFRWRAWSGIAVVSIAYLALRVVALNGLAPTVLYPDLTIWTQALTAVSNIAFYLEKLVVPVHLSAVYPSAFVHRVTLEVAAVLILAAVGVWKFRGKVAWSALWIVAALAPVLLVSRVAVPLADRDLYLPSIGFVWLLAVLLDSLRPAFSITLCSLLAVGSAVLLLEHLPAWRDDVPLFEHALAQQPDSKSARLLLASELARRGQFERATRYLDEILVREPDDRTALIDKAGVQLTMRDFAGVKSTCAKVLAIDPKAARCWYDLGYLAESEGKFSLARESYARAFQLDSELSQALLHRGLMEARLGDFNAAERTLRLAVERIPTAAALNNLGTVYAERGEFKKAVETFQTAVRVDPSFELARRNLERAIADAK